MVSYFFIAFLEYLVWDFIWARCLVWCRFVYCPLQLLFSDLEVACNLPILMDCCLVYVLRVCIWWWWKKGFLKGFCFLIVGCGTSLQCWYVCGCGYGIRVFLDLPYCCFVCCTDEVSPCFNLRLFNAIMIFIPLLLPFLFVLISSRSSIYISTLICYLALFC